MVSRVAIKTPERKKFHRLHVLLDLETGYAEVICAFGKHVVPNCVVPVDKIASTIRYTTGRDGPTADVVENHRDAAFCIIVAVLWLCSNRVRVVSKTHGVKISGLDGEQTDLSYICLHANR
ncbi:hypothetical protein HG530_009150 [Fusarium avenaceum]|nr:hypothetical protein HG530_009150 [Fusarium avenaceum]